MLAITPRGVGNPVGARKIRAGWPLAPGETFTVDLGSVAGLVLDVDELSLRAELPADTVARKDANINRMLNELFSSPDPQTQLLARVLKEIAIDVAQLKGLTLGQYKADVLARIKA